MTKEGVFKIDVIHTVKMCLITQSKLLAKEMYHIQNKFIFKFREFGRSIIDFNLYIEKN